MKLTGQEHFLIETIRKFRFLNGYHVKGIELCSSEPEITLECRRKKRRIGIRWTNTGVLELIITKIGWIFDQEIYLEELKSHFNMEDLGVTINPNNYCEIIRENADFVKRHAIMRIVNGKDWIRSISRRVRKTI